MNKINVTKTYLPPVKSYEKYLKKIWKNNWLTNNGPLVNQLEKKLRIYLETKNLLSVNNATTGLLIAIKALDLTGEVITTPFSYVATTSTLVWMGIKTVFVDIDEDSFCLNPKLIENAITKKTTGIVATHVYGNPCDVELVQKIADKYNLRIIYDAAHSFGVKYKSNSLLLYGDVSVLSFHATKIFHTIEGGAVATKNSKLAAKVSYLRNFGHKNHEEFQGIGINGKMSEFHAAMGLCVFDKISAILSARKEVSLEYDQKLDFRYLKKQKIDQNTEYNYAYYPIIFSKETALLKALKSLNNHNIFPRRYFFPPLNKLPYVKGQKMPIAESISHRALCLPLAHDLKKSDIIRVADLINLSV